MTSVFIEVLLALYTKALQHAQPSTEKEKEQSEYTNNEAGCKAVLLFGFADCRLLFDVCSKQLQVTN